MARDPHARRTKSATGTRAAIQNWAQVRQNNELNKDKRENGGRDRDRTGDPLLAKQVLSQLSYTPTVGTTYILKHFRGFQNPFLRFSIITVPKLYQNPRLQGLLAPRQGSFRWLGG